MTSPDFTADYEKGSIPNDELVIIQPRLSVPRAFCLEVICTAIFVMIILVVKTARVAPTKQGFLGCLGVVFNLLALTQTSAKSGACFNPAVGLA